MTEYKTVIKEKIQNKTFEMRMHRAPNCILDTFAQPLVLSKSTFFSTYKDF